MRPTLQAVTSKWRAKSVADLETEFKQLAMKDYLARFQITDEAFIDGDAMDKLFAPYLRRQ